MNPRFVSLMCKPVGRRCTATCLYCYYGPQTEDVSSRRTMDRATLEAMLAGYLPSASDRVPLVWQGGEPTVAGLPSFVDAVTIARRLARGGQVIVHVLQTNGTRIDEAWCRFLKQEGFLVGISIDGPPHLHDSYRRTPCGGGTYREAARAFSLLRNRGVPCNVLCAVHDKNVEAADEVWDHLLGMGARWLHFIPIVEWTTPQGPSRRLAPFSVDGEAWGRFMCRILDRWLKTPGAVSERNIDALIHRMVSGANTLCVTAPTCARHLTVEADGSVYPCDHFVSHEWCLGRVGQGGQGWRIVA